MHRAAAAAVVASLPAVLAAPAYADGELGLSHDGRHWQQRLDRPLFDPDLRWVPGDVRTARFYVRSSASDEGRLSVDVERTERSQLRASGYLHVAARADGGDWSTIRGDDLSRLIDGDVLAAGRVVAVDVRVSMDAAAPNGTMVLTSDLDLRVTLRDSRAGGPAPVVSGAGGLLPGTSGLLPATGASVAPWLPPAALGLLGVGAWLVVRRREDDRSDAPGDSSAR